MNYEPFLTVVKTVKGVPMYRESDVDEMMIKEITKGTQTNCVTRGEKKMSAELKAAENIVEESKTRLLNTMKSLNEVQTKLSEQSKKVSGDVRSAAETLSQGLSKIEKQANFDKLERYVVLLERAASAMSSLAELEKAGRLDKIIGALK